MSRPSSRASIILRESHSKCHEIGRRHAWAHVWTCEKSANFPNGGAGNWWSRKLLFCAALLHDLRSDEHLGDPEPGQPGSVPSFVEKEKRRNLLLTKQIAEKGEGGIRREEGYHD